MKRRTVLFGVAFPPFIAALDVDEPVMVGEGRWVYRFAEGETIYTADNVPWSWVAPDGRCFAARIGPEQDGYHYVNWIEV